jgi:hypothetical protein
MNAPTSIAELLLSRRRLFVTIAALLTLTGAFA